MCPYRGFAGDIRGEIRVPGSRSLNEGMEKTVQTTIKGFWVLGFQGLALGILNRKM